MKALIILERAKPSHVIVVSLLFALIHVLVNSIVVSINVLAVFNASFNVAVSMLSAIILFVFYSNAHRNKFAFSRTILWLSITMLGWAIGDTAYLLLVIKDIDPFFSISDIFYFAATLLLVIALLTIPGSQPTSRRRNMVFIEMSILVLSATVIFTILLLAPGNPYIESDIPSRLMIFAYPVLDIILIWVVMILFFTYSIRSTRKVLGLIFAAVMVIFFSDFFYVFDNLYEINLNVYYFDLGYYFFYVFILFAGLIGYKEIRNRPSEIEKNSAAFKQINWIVFIPGVLLITVIGLLIAFVLNQSFVLFHGIVFLVALIIILFIIHQYMVVMDNIRLAREMRMINAQLENKVIERTAELSKANKELLDEMKEREKVEAHLAKSNQDLALLIRDKDRFVTILAHDLRSPLGSMMNLSELLVESMEEFNKAELLEISGNLNKSATHTFQLLNDLLAWSTVQMGRGDWEKEYFAVHEVITENIKSIATEAENKKIQIHAELDQKVVAFADKYAILTVLRNLLSNAVKFTGYNGAVHLNAVQKDKFVIISVQDNGIGISDEKLKKIFRIDALHSTPGTDGEKGTGFGLLLCKDLIERNGGEIWIESVEGKGSVFYFSLPTQPNDEKQLNTSVPIATGCITCFWDNENRIVQATCVGKINIDILHSELNRIWNSSDYKTSYNSLVDVRQAELEIEIKEFSKLIDIFSNFPITQTEMKIAVLTSTPQQVALSTLFAQNVQMKYPLSIEVFSTYEAAFDWLIANQQ